MQTMRYVPLEKQSKKAKRAHYATKRTDWNGVVPVTKVIPNKKKQPTRQSRKPSATMWE
jgi:hypothetical protein